jgi:hypothetical protein
MSKDSTSMKRDTCRLNLLTFLAKFLSASILDVSAGYLRRAQIGNRE